MDVNRNGDRLLRWRKAGRRFYRVGGKQRLQLDASRLGELRQLRVKALRSFCRAGFSTTEYIAAATPVQVGVAQILFLTENGYTLVKP